MTSHNDHPISNMPPRDTWTESADSLMCRQSYLERIRVRDLLYAGGSKRLTIERNGDVVFATTLPAEQAHALAARLTPATPRIGMDQRGLINRLERIHAACADPSRPRQSVGEMIAALLDAVLTDSYPPSNTEKDPAS